MLIYILLHVDDMLLTDNNESMTNHIILQLSQKICLKQLGLTTTFLGIQIQSTNDGYFLTQQHYTADLLHKTGLYQAKLVANPLPSKASNFLALHSIVSGLVYV